MNAADKRIHRCVWLAITLVVKKSVDYKTYAKRFGVAMRTYYRDLAVLQRIGVTTDSHRDHGRVILIREAL